MDSFDPHEPWDPPVYYRRMYDEDEEAIDVVQSLYGPWEGRLGPRELKRLQANYAGKVKMVDRWFGTFIETLRATGRIDDSTQIELGDLVRKSFSAAARSQTRLRTGIICRQSAGLE